MKSIWAKTLLGVVLAMGIAVAAYAATGPRGAKISKQKAEAIALARQPGKVSEGELERENGLLIYSFDIQTTDKGIVEVQVDAKTGKVVSVEGETPQHEAEEKAGETKNP